MNAHSEFRIPLSKLCDLSSTVSTCSGYSDTYILSIVSTNTEFKNIALRDGQTAFLLNAFIIDESNEDNPVQLQLWNDQALKYKCRIVKGSILLLTHFRFVVGRENRRVIRDASIKIIDNYDDYDHNTFNQLFDRKDILAIHSFKQKNQISSYVGNDNILTNLRSVDTTCFLTSVGYYHVNIPLVIQPDAIEKLMNIYSNDNNDDVNNLATHINQSSSSINKTSFVITVFDLMGNSSKLILSYDHTEMIRNELIKMIRCHNNTTNVTESKMMGESITVLAKHIGVEHVYCKTITCFKATSRSSFSFQNKDDDDDDDKNIHILKNHSTLSTQHVPTDTHFNRNQRIDELLSPTTAAPAVSTLSWGDFIEYLRCYESPIVTSGTSSSIHVGSGATCHSNNNNLFEVRCKLIDVLFNDDDDDNDHRHDQYHHHHHSTPTHAQAVCHNDHNQPISASNLITITKNDLFNHQPNAASVATNVATSIIDGQHKRPRMYSMDDVDTKYHLDRNNHTTITTTAIDTADGRLTSSSSSSSVVDVIIRYRSIKFILGSPTDPSAGIAVSNSTSTPVRVKDHEAISNTFIVIKDDDCHTDINNITAAATSKSTMTTVGDVSINVNVSNSKVISTLEFYNTQTTCTAPVNSNTYKDGADDIGMMSSMASPPTTIHHFHHSNLNTKQKDDHNNTAAVNNNSYYSQSSYAFNGFTGVSSCSSSNSSSSTSGGLTSIRLTAGAGDECIRKLVSNIPADVFSLSSLHNSKQQRLETPSREAQYRCGDVTNSSSSSSSSRKRSSSRESTSSSSCSNNSSSNRNGRGSCSSSSDDDKHTTTSSSSSSEDFAAFHTLQQQSIIHHALNTQTTTPTTITTTNTTTSTSVPPPTQLYDYERAVLDLYAALKQSAINGDEFVFRLAVLPLADENGMLLSENVIFVDSFVL